MAKKAPKREEMKPAKQQKTTSNRGTIVGIIIVAAVIVILILLLRGGKEAAAPTGPAPTAPTAPTAKKTVELAPTPEFQSYCKSADGITAVTLSYITASCKVSDGTVTFNMKNPTKATDVEGVYFEATSSSGKKSYVVNKEVVGPGETNSYSIDLNALSQEIGESVTDILVYPAQAGNACLNGRSVIIKDQTCVR